LIGVEEGAEVAVEVPSKRQNPARRGVVKLDLSLGGVFGKNWIA
jgi:hypothetical protein